MTDNGLKLLVTHRLVHGAAVSSALFIDGRYEPLVVRGRRAEHVIAFARIDGDRAGRDSRSATGRRSATARLNRPTIGGMIPLSSWRWRVADRPWRSRDLPGARFSRGRLELPVADLLRPLPVAVLMS